MHLDSHIVTRESSSVPDDAPKRLVDATLTEGNEEHQTGPPSLVVIPFGGSSETSLTLLQPAEYTPPELSEPDVDDVASLSIASK